MSRDDQGVLDDAIPKILHNDDPTVVLEGVIMVRKLLSLEQSPPIDLVVDTQGLLPKLVELLHHPNDQIVLNAAWALTNVACGNSTHVLSVVSSGALPPIIALLSHPQEDIREQACWCIGNIAGDSVAHRDLVLNHGAMVLLCECLQSSGRTSMLRTGSWAVSNLCRGRPSPDFDHVEPCLPTLTKLLMADDNDVLTDVVWALSYLTDGPHNQIQAVLESGALPHLVRLLSSPRSGVTVPALRALGNVVTGDGAQTQAALDCGLLRALLPLLAVPKLEKEACWTLSNITAGSSRQIQAVIDAGFLPRMVSRCRSPAVSMQIKKECTWVLANATTGGLFDQHQQFVADNVLDALTESLDMSDVRIVDVALEGISNVVSALSCHAHLEMGMDVELGEAVSLALSDVPKLSRTLVSLMSSSRDSEDKAQNIFDAGVMMRHATSHDDIDSFLTFLESATPTFINCHGMHMGDVMAASVLESMTDVDSAQFLTLAENDLTELPGLSQFLRAKNCRVHTLDLSGNAFSPSALKVVLESIATSRTLERVFLNDVGLSEASLSSLIHVVKTTETISELSILDNDLDEELCTQLHQAIYNYNGSLQVVWAPYRILRLETAVRRNRTMIQWSAIHPKLMDFCVAFAPMRLPAYVLLEIWNCTDVNMHLVGHVKKISLIVAIKKFYDSRHS